jgi:hypothetical protein
MLPLGEWMGFYGERMLSPESAHWWEAPDRGALMNDGHPTPDGDTTFT